MMSVEECCFFIHVVILLKIGRFSFFKIIRIEGQQKADKFFYFLSAFCCPLSYIIQKKGECFSAVERVYGSLLLPQYFCWLVSMSVLYLERWRMILSLLVTMLYLCTLRHSANVYIILEKRG